MRSDNTEAVIWSCYNGPHLWGMLSHSLPLFRGKSRKKYTLYLY